MSAPGTQGKAASEGSSLERGVSGSHVQPMLVIDCGCWAH